MDCLAIFAAGKASRFGGFPKAFCDLNGIRNVENTIALAQKHFSKIFLIVNEETYTSGIATGVDAEIISIVTGQGDADSILKSLKRITVERGIDVLFACWGDAVFLTDDPFLELKAGLSTWNIRSPVLVGCSWDGKPYAWFDVDGKSIVRTHFRKNEFEPYSTGLHDQSIFAFRTGTLLDYLMRRKHDLGLDAFDDNTYDVTRGEMGLLDTLTWFYEQPDLCAAEYCEITPNRVMSFNDPAELEQVIKMLKNFRKRDKKEC